MRKKMLSKGMLGTTFVVLTSIFSSSLTAAPGAGGFTVGRSGGVSTMSQIESDGSQPVAPATKPSNTIKPNFALPRPLLPIPPRPLPIQPPPPPPPKPCANTNWWMTGSHTWDSRNNLLYSWNNITAHTKTFWGSATEPCLDTPMIVDIIQVKGRNYGASTNAAVDRTDYNVAAVSAHDYKETTGSGGTGVCGATVDHTATKNGITLSSRSSSMPVTGYCP